MSSPRRHGEHGEEAMLIDEDLTGKIIGAAIEVHRELGPGLLESAVLELKAVEKIEPIHEAQSMTYMRLSGKRVGLLMNFNVPVMNQGIKRRVL
jgi:hypothetical protein